MMHYLLEKLKSPDGFWLKITLLSGVSMDIDVTKVLTDSVVGVNQNNNREVIIPYHAVCTLEVGE